jgi:ubiquinone/menaquinone biosynthesis C-methylase UbiE
MSLYRKQVLPRYTNRALGRAEYNNIRGRVTEGLAGDVLEIGFGSGLNVPHYPQGVQQVMAVEPSMVARGLAAERVKRRGVPVEYIGIDGQRLQLASASVDHVLITWTMCTIPDTESALREMHRVLRTGGQLHFAEHGRSPDADVARWQDRLTPLQSLAFGGCRLNRPIESLIANAGFDIVQMKNYYLGGPKPMRCIYEGLAARN